MDAEERGIAALQELLREWGVPREETEFEEGAGLSRKNLVTARATARVLQVMDQSALSDVWWSAFPVAGVDGTLRTRFLNSPAQGRVRAKTGTLRHVSALAGELHSNEGKRHWAFVVVANGFVDGTGQTSPVRELDTWVKALSEFAADPSAF
jgi:D-alanyl-D-alanine carboxypeptidase/D-alanyl-D-alanine-endopeptidase (penicillin-binding protein 4)